MKTGKQLYGLCFSVWCSSVGRTTFPRAATRWSVRKSSTCAMSSERPGISGRTLTAVSACSAVLGPLLDNYHSRFHVLTYSNPIDLQFSVSGMRVNVITAPFTPPLFVIAGLIISSGVCFLNQLLSSYPRAKEHISGPRAMATIASFSSIYYLSATLPNSEIGIATGPLLSFLAIAEWFWLDGSPGGLILSLLTAFCGPAVEAGLINITHLYAYTSPEYYGIPLFIGPVYFAGGSAVGNLARAIESIDIGSNKDADMG